MMKVLLVYEIDAFRRRAARANPLRLKGSGHREYKGCSARRAPSAEQKMTVQEAFTLFRRLGVDPQALSRREFSAAYYRLAWRYHPDRNPNTEEVMANINAARSTILQT